MTDEDKMVTGRTDPALYDSFVKLLNERFKKAKDETELAEAHAVVLATLTDLYSYAIANTVDKSGLSMFIEQLDEQIEHEYQRIEKANQQKEADEATTH